MLLSWFVLSAVGFLSMVKRRCDAEKKSFVTDTLILSSDSDTLIQTWINSISIKFTIRGDMTGILSAIMKT